MLKCYEIPKKIEFFSVTKKKPIFFTYFLICTKMYIL